MTGLFSTRRTRGLSRRGGAAPAPAAHEALESRLLLATVTPAGEETVPAAPTTLRARPYGPDEHRLTWADRSDNETGFVVSRRVAGGTFDELVTLPAGTVQYVDAISAAEFAARTVFEYQVHAFNDAGPSAPTAVSTVTFRSHDGTGLRQRIWNDIDPAGREGVGAPAVDRVDPFLSHDWGDGSPAPEIDPDTFAVEWVGEVVAEETKAYMFSVVADRGARLFLNDVLITRGGGTRSSDDQAYEDFSEPLSVTAGQKVKVRLQYVEQAGAATARLRWNGPGNVREDVPSVFLFPTLGPADAVDQVAHRPVSYPRAFGLPPARGENRANVAVRWQDNAFAEAGYEIQRATDAAFTQNLATVSGGASPAAGPGSELFVDDGSSTAGNPGPLDRSTRYHYRVRPIGAPDAAWVNTGSARLDRFAAGTDFTVPNFPSPQFVTLNGDATTTTEGTLRLANNQNNQNGSAYINGSFGVSDAFKVNFDFQISNSNGADGMTFVIHNHRPAGAGASQLKVLGGSDTDGSGLGYRGIPSSVAVTFDVHQNLDQLGLFSNGAVPAAGNVPATRVNDPAMWPLDPNATLDLRLPENGAIDLNNGTIYDFVGVYNNATKAFRIEIRRADADPSSTPLFTTMFMIDLPAIVGGDEAVMGFTAANGGLNSDFEVHNFKYDGPNEPPPPPPPPIMIDAVFVRGSSWANNPSFGDWFESNGYGLRTFGYRVDRLAAATTAADTTIPWTNVNQLVVHYTGPVTGGGPQPGSYTVTGTHGAYTVTAVEQVGTDGTTFALTLNRALGVLPDLSGTDGDRVQLQVSGGGAGDAAYSLLMNSMQGDTDRRNGRVNANDVGTVRSRQNRTAAEVPPTGLAPYTAFADLDTNGRINANDVGSVRSRQNDVLPAAPAPAGVPALPVTGAAPFGTRRIRPGGRPELADLLA